MRDTTWDFFSLFHQLHKMMEIPMQEVQRELSRAEFPILIYLSHQEAKAQSQTVSAIAKKLQVSSPAISRSLGVLEQKGLIERQIDAKDRRATVVRITAQGEAMLERAQHQICDFLESVLGQMSPEDVAHFRDYMTQFFGIVQKELDKRKQQGLESSQQRCFEKLYLDEKENAKKVMKKGTN